MAEQTELDIIVAIGLDTYDDMPHQYEHRGPGLLLDLPRDLMIDDVTRDIRDGIAGTGVKTAFLTCVVEAKGLTPGVERNLRACAATHRATGAPITVHTSAGNQAGRLALFNPRSSRVDTIVARAERGYADRMVLAHDASCYIDYFPGVEAQAAKEQIAPNWNVTHISKDVLPMLRERGMTDDQPRQMLVEAPRRYFE